MHIILFMSINFLYTLLIFKLVNISFVVKRKAKGDISIMFGIPKGLNK